MQSLGCPDSQGDAQRPYRHAYFPVLLTLNITGPCLFARQAQRGQGQHSMPPSHLSSLLEE